MSINLLEYTQDEITGPVPKEITRPVTQVISNEEFEKLAEELKEKQANRLEKCKNVDGDWRCEKCRSSLWYSEVRFRYVSKESHKLIGTHCVIKKVWFCVNTDCEKPPPLVSSIGVIRPDQENDSLAKEDNIRGRIETLRVKAKPVGDIQKLG